MSTFLKIILGPKMELLFFSILSKCRKFGLSECRHFRFIKMSTFQSK